MTTMLKNIVKKLIWGILVFLFIVFVLTLFTFCVSFYLKLMNNTFLENEYENKQSKDYRYYRVDHSTNAPSFGFLTLPRHLEGDEYISYHDEKGYVLISNFGSEEFKCEGICSCDTSNSNIDRRRSHVSSISRRVISLVVAVSSMVAIQTSRNQVDEECQEILKDECLPPNAIISEVEDCKNVKGESQVEEEVLDGKNPNDIRFTCLGKCQNVEKEYLDKMYDDPYFDENPNKMKETWESIKKTECSWFHIKTDITIERKDPSAYKKQTEAMKASLCIDPDKPCVLDTPHSFVEYQFTFNQLEKFCSKMGHIVETKKDKYSHCHGFRNYRRFSNEIFPVATMKEINPTVGCFEKKGDEDPPEISRKMEENN